MLLQVQVEDFPQFFLVFVVDLLLRRTVGRTVRGSLELLVMLHTKQPTTLAKKTTTLIVEALLNPLMRMVLMMRQTPWLNGTRNMAITSQLLLLLLLLLASS